MIYHTQNGLDVYRKYIALKLHFLDPSYDYFKYHGATGASFAAYQRRKDALFFEQIARNYGSDSEEYMAFNLAMNIKIYPRELATSKGCEDIYYALKKDIDSLSYVIENFSKEHDIVDVLKPRDPHPKLLQLLIVNKIPLVVACVLECIINYVKIFDKTISETLVWPKYSNRIKKLLPFLVFDKLKVANQIIKILKESKND